jgi:hypothetical protein
MIPVSPIGSPAGAGADDIDGTDAAEALRDGANEGLRNTQLASMHSANIGIVALNRIVNLLIRPVVETAARRRCSGDATREGVADGAGAASARAGVSSCAIA